MPARPSAPAASRRLYGPPKPLSNSVFYASLYGSFLVLNLVWTSRGIGQPEAFCAGTTAAYRNGNGSDSALIPFTTLRLLLTPAPVDVHPAWRAGFDTCHGSDICDGTYWAKVQADAEAAGVYSAVVLTLTMLILLGNTVLIIKKHTAGLAISWKLLAVMPLLYFPMPFILAAVSAPAQALRFRANEVAGLPSPAAPTPVPLPAPLSHLGASSPPPLLLLLRDRFPSRVPGTVLQHGRERHCLRQEPGPVRRPSQVSQHQDNRRDVAEPQERVVSGLGVR